MTKAQRKVDSASVTSATDMAINICQDMVKAVMGFLTDPLAKERRNHAGECKKCFYIYPARIGGSAMTMEPCGVCGKEVWYGNTSTDRLCMTCALEHKLCKHCGGDVEMRPRRKYVSPEEANEA